MEAKNAAYIVSTVRTAVGKANKGTLRNMRPETLGALAVRGALDRAGSVPDDRVEDVLIGCAMPEGPQGMNMGRIVAQAAGLPDTVPGATINRFCSSGLQTVVLASQAIAVGQADVIVAGGTESMSSVPMSGYYFSPDPAVVAQDPDVYVSMGNTAENVAAKYGISREDQDRFALQSHEKALAAISAGRFQDEIVAVDVEDTSYADGEVVTRNTSFSVDEGPRVGSTFEALARLRPVFRNRGSVTAGNSSQMSDGAAATLVMSDRAVSEFGVDPLGRIVGFSVAGVAPELMGIGPVEAVPKVLRQTGLELKDIGLFELNEAFAAQGLAVIRELGLDPDRVNVNGGAIALGHPLGCTGAKLLATLLHEMRRRGERYGICTMCIGGGMGAAAVVENLAL
ncbi:MAG: thiolase family protein [Rhodothermales bacterium]|nr:thiolase family protein [Rhodothermales bacterium]